MTPALMSIIYLPGRQTIHSHEAWDHCSIIDWWAVESLKTVIDDGLHAFYLYNAERRGQGGKKLN